MALILCPKCQNQFQGPPGARVKCPHCGTQLETPPSAQQIERQKKESAKRYRWITAAIVTILVLLSSYLIWDAATFTEKEYNEARDKILEEIDQHMEETVDYLAQKSLAELEYKLADTQSERDRAYTAMEFKNRMYTMSKDALERSEQELDNLQEKYESGIWYKLFG